MIEHHNKTWIAGLNSLRFVLASIVVIAHLSPAQVILADGPAQKIFRGIIGNSFVGVAAVIAFFIISGVVIHLPYRNGKKLNAGEFLLKRYIRIGAPMIAVIYLGNLLAVKISAFPFWSLYCELIYYTIYPLLLYFLRKYPKSHLLIPSTLIISSLLVILDSTVLSDFLLQRKDFNGNYWQHGPALTWLLGLPCWLLGVKITQELNQRGETSRKKLYFIRLLVLSAAFICSYGRFHLSLSYTITLNAFSFLAAYWIRAEMFFWKRNRPFGWLENAGKWSYSLYICHPFPWLVIPVVMRQQNALTFIIQLTTSLIFAYLFYLLIERPSHLLAQKIGKNKPKTITIPQSLV